MQVILTVMSKAICLNGINGNLYNGNLAINVRNDIWRKRQRTTEAIKRVRRIGLLSFSSGYFDGSVGKENNFMIHIVAVRIPSVIDQETLNKLMMLVSEEKRTKMLRFRFAADVHRTLLAEVLLRLELCERLRVPNSELIFVTNSYGKPYLEHISGCSFNLAHSGNWVACAIGKEPIGIDVEQIRSIDINIAKRYFSALEYKDLISQEEPTKYFYDLWSLKESYIKMIGRGLSIPLDSFSIRKETDERITLAVHGDKPYLIQEVRFIQYDIDPEYRFAVCAVEEPLPAQCVTYEFTDVIARALQLR